MRDNRAVIAAFVFMVLARAVFLPLFPLTDNTESRYAVIAADMQSSGDWVTPRVWIEGRQVPYLGKPPLLFWAAALGIQLFGHNEFAVRFPSFMFSIFLVVLLNWVLRKYLEPDTADSASLILASSALFFLFSGTVIVDMTLTFFASAAVLFHYALANEKSKELKKIFSLLVFISLGHGFLTKGPLCLVLFGIPVVLWSAINKKWGVLRDYNWLTGLAAFAIIAAPWFVLAEIRSPGFLQYFFINENILRFTSADYGDRYGWGHVLPYGTAFLFFLAAALPWSIWCTVLAFKKSRWKSLAVFYKDERTSIFSLGAIGIVLFLCLARQIVAAYVIPVLPFFAVSAALFLRNNGVSKKQIALVCVVSIVVYSAISISFLPRAGEKYSAKEIISAARDIGRLQSAGKVTFLFNMPYSAYFYGRGLVLNQDKETLPNIARGPNPADVSNLYIVRKKDEASIPGAVSEKLSPVYSSDNWTIYENRAAHLHGKI